MEKIADWSNGIDYSYPDLKDGHMSIADIISKTRNKQRTEYWVGYEARMEPKEIEFNVENGTHSILGLLTFGGVQGADRIDFKIISPNLDEYHSSTVNDAWRYIGRIEIENSLENPIIPGEWVAIFNTFSDWVSRSHSLSVDIDSDIRVRISEFPFQQTFTDNMDITVEIKDFQTPITDAEVYVEVVIPNDPEDIIQNFPLVHDGNDEGTYRVSHTPYPYSGDITFNMYINIDSHNSQRRSTETVIVEADPNFDPEIQVVIAPLPPQLYYNDTLEMNVSIEEFLGPVTDADVWVDIIINADPDPILFPGLPLIHDQQNEGTYLLDFIPFPYTGMMILEISMYLPLRDVLIPHVETVMVFGD